LRFVKWRAMMQKGPRSGENWKIMQAWVPVER
jgi:hypothetical protein